MEKIYLLITPNFVIEIPGFYAPQFRQHGIIMRIICFLITFIFLHESKYPRKDLVITQSYPGLFISNKISWALIEICRKNKYDNYDNIYKFIFIEYRKYFNNR